MVKDLPFCFFFPIISCTQIHQLQVLLAWMHCLRNYLAPLPLCFVTAFQFKGSFVLSCQITVISFFLFILVSLVFFLMLKYLS